MGLLDFIFRRTRTPVTQAAGTSGVAAFGGKLVTFENRPDLQGRNLYLTLTNTIANTAIVGTAVRYYQNLIGGTSWSVEPKEGTGAEGERAADLVREGLFEANMPEPWSTCVKRASLYRMIGFSAHEWTMRRRPKDGRMVFASIEHRPQATVEFWDVPDKGGELRGIVQRPLVWGDYYYVARDRLWYCVDNSLTDSPDGVGLLRHVVEHARRLGRYEQIEGYGYEKDMRGIPVGRIPYQHLHEYAKAKGKGDAWVAAQVKPLEDMVKNHIMNPFQGMTLDSQIYQGTGQNGPIFTSTPQWALDLLKGDAVGLAEIHGVIERINREIARCLGMEFLMLGADGKGSLALSRDKTSMFASIIESSLHELAWFTVHDLVYPLLRMNGLDPEALAPQVMPDPIATERIEVTVDALAKLAQAGAVLRPNDAAVDQIRRRLHLVEQPRVTVEVDAGAPRGEAEPGDGDDGDADREAPDRQPDEPEKRATPGTFRKTPEDAANGVDYVAMEFEVDPETLEVDPDLVTAVLAKRITKVAVLADSPMWHAWARLNGGELRPTFLAETQTGALAHLRSIDAAAPGGKRW